MSVTTVMSHANTVLLDKNRLIMFWDLHNGCRKKRMRQKLNGRGPGLLEPGTPGGGGGGGQVWDFLKASTARAANIF